MRPKCPVLLISLLLATAGCRSATETDAPPENNSHVRDLAGAWQLVQQDNTPLQGDTQIVVHFATDGLFRVESNGSELTTGRYRLDSSEDPAELIIELENDREYHLAQLRSDGLLELAEGLSAFPANFSDAATTRLYRPVVSTSGAATPDPNSPLAQLLQGTWQGRKEEGNTVYAWVVYYPASGEARMLEVMMDKQFKTYQRIDLDFRWAIEDDMLVEYHGSATEPSVARYDVVEITADLLSCRRLDSAEGQVIRHQRAVDFESAVALLPSRPEGYREVKRP